MTTRTVYHVVPDRASGQWKVTQEGSGQELSRHNTQAEAIAQARETAQVNRPSQVIVHGEDGTIRTEWTYEDDPYPPAG